MEETWDWDGPIDDDASTFFVGSSNSDSGLLTPRISDNSVTQNTEDNHDDIGSGTEIGMEVDTVQISGAGSLEIADGYNNDSMNVSTCSNTNSIGSETHYIGSYFNQDEDAQNIDVVDGQVDTGNTNSQNEVHTSSTNSLISLIECLPPSSTRAEHIARISQWVLDSVPTVPSDENANLSGNDETGAIDFIESLIRLCASKLDNCPLFLSTVGSVTEFEEGCDTVFQLIFRLLESKYITEALMQIVNLIWATKSNSNHVKEILTSEEDDEDKVFKSRRLMLTVLNFASEKKTRIPKVMVEKILSHDIFTDTQYFDNVSLCTSIKSPSKEFTIFRGIETWINNALTVAFECKTAILDLDIRIILTVITELNRERGLYLSPEEESKYAAKAQRVIREIFFTRCHTFLKSQGFEFEILQLQEREMPSNRLQNDRVVPNPPTTGAGGHNPGGRFATYDAWLQYEMIDAWYAIERDERNVARNYGGSSPPYLVGGNSSSQESRASLQEGVINLDDIQFGRLSQESLQSRMNQGYTSSQSLSQGSLPRLSNSQSSNNSAIMRFVNLDNQYILENQFLPSSPESSQEPPGKRLRFSSQ